MQSLATLAAAALATGDIKSLIAADIGPHRVKPNAPRDPLVRTVDTGYRNPETHLQLQAVRAGYGVPTRWTGRNGTVMIGYYEKPAIRPNVSRKHKQVVYDGKTVQL